MSPGERPLNNSEQKAISRAAKLCARSTERPANRGAADADATQACRALRRVAIGRKARSFGAVTLEQRLVTLFTD